MAQYERHVMKIYGISQESFDIMNNLCNVIKKGTSYKESPFGYLSDVFRSIHLYPDNIGDAIKNNP